MIDIHTHILPGIDDGSASVEESLGMLKMLKEQGVDAVAATPHFYSDRIDTAHFLSARSAAFEKLLTAAGSAAERPKLTFGAEVLFYTELYALDGLESLCLDGTNYILVEMPFEKWSDYTYLALEKISTERGLIPIAAHIERYTDIQKDRDMVDRLIDAGAKIQINASFINEFATRGRALRLLKRNAVSFIGSDSHNLKSRKPNFGPAVKTVQKRLGRDGLGRIDYEEQQLLETLRLY